MFIMSIHCVQRHLPTRFAFELFETRAFPLLGGNTNTFTLVMGEVIDVLVEMSQILLALLEQCTNIVGQGLPNANCDACSRCCGQYLDEDIVGQDLPKARFDACSRCYSQYFDGEDVPHNRPGLGAHLPAGSVSVSLFLRTMHQERCSRLDEKKANDVDVNANGGD